jgi:hypothetical protein
VALSWALHDDRDAAVVPFMIQPLPNRQRTTARVASEPALNVLVIGNTPEARIEVRLALEAAGFVL